MDAALRLQKQQEEAMRLTSEADVSYGRAMHLLKSCYDSYSQALVEARRSHLPAICAVAPTEKQVEALRLYCAGHEIRVESFTYMELKPIYEVYVNLQQSEKAAGRPRPNEVEHLFVPIFEHVLAFDSFPGGCLCCVTFTDIYVSFTDWANENLGLDGWNAYKTSLSRIDKFSMQNALKSCGMKHARSAVVRSPEEAFHCFMEEGFKFPIVLKPTDGAGSEGLSLCHNAVEMEVACKATFGLKSHSMCPIESICVQEYLVGEEYVVDAVSCRGVHVVTDVWKSYKFPVKFDEIDGVPRYNIMYDRQELLLDCSTGNGHKAAQYIARCLDAVGFSSGASHSELIILDDGNEPCLLEVNARLQGDLPRSGPIVGYDQLTLLAYLAAIRNDAANGSWPPPGIQPFYRLPYCESAAQKEDPIQRPDIGKLAHPTVQPLWARSKLSMTISPRTRHVVFLLVEEDSVLLEQSKAYIRRFLPTFMYFTRAGIDRTPPPGRVFKVSKTVDLFSSPAAIVLEGATDELLRDTEMIRAMEKSHFVLAPDGSEWGKLVSQVFPRPPPAAYPGHPQPPPMYVSQQFHHQLGFASDFIFSWKCPWDPPIVRVGHVTELPDMD